MYVCMYVYIYIYIYIALAVPCPSVDEPRVERGRRLWGLSTSGDDSFADALPFVTTGAEFGWALCPALS